MTEFELDFKKKFSTLKTEFQNIEKEIQEVLKASLIEGTKSSGYWNITRQKINTLYLDMENLFIAWSEKNIPWRFRQSIKQMMYKINGTKIITNRAKFIFSELMKTNNARNISKILYDDAILSMIGALENGKAKILQLTRLTQQRLIDESLISTTLAGSIEFGNINQAVKRLSNSLEVNLWNQVNAKQFVIAGTRKFSPAYYSEMVCRTKFHEAQSQATLLTCNNYDTDLVQVSSHNTTTAICMPFEGKIFSVSGKDNRFPPLMDEPPFHPNCLHLMYPYFESALEATGKLQEYSDFSLGKIARPPGKNSFIPIANRKSA